MKHKHAAAWLLAATLVRPTAAAENTALLAHWPLDEQTGSQAKDMVSGRADPVSYVFNHARFKPDSSPLWHAAGSCVVNGCLQFDGYSTDVSAPGLSEAQLQQGFTLSAWVSPPCLRVGGWRPLFGLPQPV